MNTFIQKDALNWLKVTVKTMLQKILFQINAGLLNVIFIKRILKKMYLNLYKGIKQ